MKHVPPKSSKDLSLQPKTRFQCDGRLVAATLWALLRLPPKRVNDLPKGEGGSVSSWRRDLEAEDVLEVDDRRLALELDDERPINPRDESDLSILSSVWRRRDLVADAERGRLEADEWRRRWRGSTQDCTSAAVMSLLELSPKSLLRLSARSNQVRHCERIL